jgi:hypothetical protein
MRKIITLVCFLWPVAHLHAQPNMEIKMSIKEDTARSFFNHIPVSIALNYEDSLVLTSSNHNCYIEGRVLNKEWVGMNNRPPASRYTTHIYDGEWAEYGSLFKIFEHMDSSEIVQYATNGVHVEFRYRILGKFLGDSSIPKSYYSNTDTLFLLPATNSDLAAFFFLLKEVELKPGFIWLWQWDFTQPDFDNFKHIVDNYPTSLFADFAKYRLIQQYTSAHLVNGQLNEVDRNKIKLDYLNLINTTQSELLKAQFKACYDSL